MPKTVVAARNGLANSTSSKPISAPSARSRETSGGQAELIKAKEEKETAEKELEELKVRHIEHFLDCYIADTRTGQD